MSGEGEKLGMCDCWAGHHGKEPHVKDAYLSPQSKRGACVNWREQPAQGEPYRHSNGEIDFPNGDRVRWANGWWMADRKGGESSKHRSPKEAEAALAGDKATERETRTCMYPIDSLHICNREPGHSGHHSFVAASSSGMSAEQFCRQKFEEEYPVQQYRDGPPLEVTKAIHYGNLKREWDAFQKGWKASDREAYAELKVREHVKAINRLEKAELSALAELDDARAELAKLREELERLKAGT